MPRNIKLTIEYDGTDFKGWQVQARGSRTVQGEIEKALKTIFKETVRVIGSGRTDSGVHALDQVAHCQTRSSLPTSDIQRALNANLPEDIAILKVEDVKKDFHAQYSPKSKVYRYTILNRSYRCAHERKFCLHYPHKLNLSRMRQEAKALVGKKDFKSFQASDPRKPLHKRGSTIRHIKQVTIRKKNDFITIDIEADGFLYKMVRNIVGTLLDVGTGKIPKGSIKKILAQKNRMFASTTAKALGLTLYRVNYPKN